MATVQKARRRPEPERGGGATVPRSAVGPVAGPSSVMLSRVVWGLLAYTCAVLLFGAFVRASYSGDGCGTSWPLCQGHLVPPPTDVARTIEFTHRATSGLLLLGVAVAYGWSRRVYARRAPVRTALGLALLTTVVSALIGAALVIFQMVTDDKSAGRAVTMPLHLVNNYVLVAALVFAAFWAGGGRETVWRGQGQVLRGLKWLAGGLFALGATGAFSALGKTAFEHELRGARNLAERAMMHVGDGAHPLLKGGVVHPLIATSVGLLLVWVCGSIVQARPDPQVRKWARWSVGLFVVQYLFGAANLVASAPVAMQIGHLALAIAGWVALVMLAAYALGKGTPQAEPVERAPSAPRPEPAAGAMALVRDYVALTKPRVVSLLLFTTVAAMVVAARGAPGFWLTLWVCVGGYMMAGAANAFNMSVEADLDEAMGRTATRPTVTHRIGKRQAQAFATVLMVGAFGLLWASANLLSAVLALCGLLCYVFVYTLWLKRRTWQNIVIGGAAGAFPPLVGYAAVSGHLSPIAWYLFAIVFTWTPVHFWALALLLKDDYARAGVPMLPVVKGERVTADQIGLYALVTAVVSVLPFFQGEAGLVYLVGSALLNLGLVAQSLRLWLCTERPQARALFKFSMAYLALFFIVIAIDQVRWVS